VARTFSDQDWYRVRWASHPIEVGVPDSRQIICAFTRQTKQYDACCQLAQQARARKCGRASIESCDGISITRHSGIDPLRVHTWKARVPHEIAEAKMAVDMHRDDKSIRHGQSDRHRREALHILSPDPSVATNTLRDDQPTRASAEDRRTNTLDELSPWWPRRAMRLVEYVREDHIWEAAVAAREDVPRSKDEALVLVVANGRRGVTPQSIIAFGECDSVNLING
jgi:hypothetical protein